VTTPPDKLPKRKGGVVSTGQAGLEPTTARFGDESSTN
jgi:hypothetical protein